MTLNMATIKEKLAHPGFQRYFKNTGWLFTGRMFNLFVAFFVGIYIARYLGPAQYGLLNYAMSFSGLFAFLASLGIDGILNRELVKYPEKRNVLLGTGFYIKLFGSIFTVLIIMIISLIINPDKFTNVLVFVFSLTYIFQAFNVIDLYFQSQVLSKNTVRVQIISTIITTILKLLLIYWGLGVFWLMLIYLYESINIAVGLVITFKRNKFKISGWQFDKVLAREILKNSWPLMLTVAAASIYSRIDQIMIKHMLDDEAVGIYSVAVKISEIWYFIPSLICASLFPAIVNAKKVSEDLYLKRLQKLYFSMFWIAIGVAIPTSLMSGVIISTLFGATYAGAAPILAVYVWAGISVFLGMAISQYLMAENYSRILFYMTLSGVISNVALNMILIPKIGIMGAAFATLISYSIATISVIFFKRTRNQGILLLKSFFLFRNINKNI